LTNFGDGKDCSLIDKADAAFGPRQEGTGDQPKLKDIAVGQQKEYVPCIAEVQSEKQLSISFIRPSGLPRLCESATSYAPQIIHSSISQRRV
jgi:hypothetical protein